MAKIETGTQGTYPSLSTGQNNAPIDRSDLDMYDQTSLIPFVKHSNDLSRESCLIESTACAYLSLPHVPFESINDFSRWIVDQFHRLPWSVEFVDYDPYPCFENMYAEVSSTRTLKIATLNNDSMLEPWVNLCFRAVHDTDHLVYREDFSIHGERSVCRAIMNRCGDYLGQKFLFSEIYGQASVFHVTGSFTSQKSVLFPDSLIDQSLRH